MKKIVVRMMSVLIILTIINTVFTVGLFNEYRLNRENKEYFRDEAGILLGGHKINGNYYSNITMAISIYEASRLGVIDGDLFENLQGKTPEQVEEILVSRIKKQVNEKDLENRTDLLSEWLDEEVSDPNNPKGTCSRAEALTMIQNDISTKLGML
ncbi:MAG: hypothetical protein ACK5HR_03100 [Mycoplasmatales bacterium]